MGLLNWVSKIGRKSVGVLQGGLSHAWKGAQWLSREIGQIESQADKFLDAVANVPIIGEFADLIRDNSIYKGAKGITNDIRGIIESDKTASIVDHLLDFDFEAHTVSEHIPAQGPRAVPGDLGFIGASPPGLVPVSLNSSASIGPSSSVSNFAIA